MSGDNIMHANSIIFIIRKKQWKEKMYLIIADTITMQTTLNISVLNNNKDLFSKVDRNNKKRRYLASPTFYRKHYMTTK